MFFIHLMSRDSANWGEKKEKKRENERGEKRYFTIAVIFEKKNCFCIRSLLI